MKIQILSFLFLAVSGFSSARYAQDDELTGSYIILDKGFSGLTNRGA